eukprot:6454994-Amphidinium_carterae.1
MRLAVRPITLPSASAGGRHGKCKGLWMRESHGKHHGAGAIHRWRCCARCALTLHGTNSCLVTAAIEGDRIPLSLERQHHVPLLCWKVIPGVLALDCVCPHPLTTGDGNELGTSFLLCDEFASSELAKGNDGRESTIVLVSVWRCLGVSGHTNRSKGEWSSAEGCHSHDGL